LRVIPYKPRDVFKPFHGRKQRFSVGVAHRRCGKTVAHLNDMAKRAGMLELKDGRFAYLAPQYNQAKDVAWTYLKYYTEGIRRDKNESELWVELINKARIRIYGADNEDRLRGSYLDGIVIDEYADMRPSIWGAVIRPMLADRRGWASFIGTPKGRNAFYTLYKVGLDEPDRWYTFMLKASETRILDQEELDDARRSMTPEQYEQEFECSFEAAIVGAYFGREMAEAEREGRIVSYPIEPLAPVHRAWDLGIGNSTAIWFFQIIANEIRLVDYYENHGFAIPHYASVIQSKGYPPGTDYVPHDAKIRDYGTGRTRIETMIGSGLIPELVPDHRLEDGINSAKILLKHCWFNEEKTREGCEALRQYHATFDEKTRAFSNKPHPDWTSHCADAFRYVCMAYKQLEAAPPKKAPMKTIHEATLDDLWEAEQRRQGRNSRRI
jgi:hypothetical protein